MDKFTVEEINLMCVFEGQDRTGMIAEIKNIIPHIQDSDMVELAEQVTGKLEAMSDEEFAQVALDAAE
ncbi:transposon-transfer assisting family protein [Mediterraneibacter agrestimuris]|uniref:transposon-transfer assisting family protein n=1 Tax=Mediterraneibacter agrestimuris TaxID=2941333 RepID=UPI00203B16A4|nr:transposon-transfer assisting family protein [Mediterraneibacter agrestimuris]